MTTFKGIIAAMPTPFDDNGALDIKTLEIYTEHLVNSGITGLLAGGSTGEGPLLTNDELALVLDTIRNKAPNAYLISGATTFAMDVIKERMQISKDRGADAVLIPPSPYVKPNRLVDFYEELANAVNIPIIAYNVPSRTGLDIPEVVVQALMDTLQGRVIGLKEATEDVYRVARYVKYAQEHGYDFAIYSGTDSLNLPMLSVGASGAISVLAAIAPASMVQIYDDFVAGRVVDAYTRNQPLYFLTDALFVESNPVPIKSGLVQLDIFKYKTVRKPLWPASIDTEHIMHDALEEAGLL